MHEIAYAMELLEGIEKAAKEAGDARVTLVKVKLGSAREISPEALRAAFDWIKPDTMAEAANLAIAVIPIKIRCTLCDHTYVTEVALDECSRCGALGGEILSGDEFLITSVEMEEVEALAH